MTTVDEVLAHHGVKGMKWGKRKAASLGPSDVSVKAVPGKKLKTSGGERHLPSEDAIKAVVSRQKAKKSSVHSLSNKELQDLVTRMNLEQQFSRLNAGQKSAGAKFVSQLLGTAGKQEAQKAVNAQAAELGKKLAK